MQSPGILTQVSIVAAQLFTHIIGLNMATPTQWRFVLFVSSGLGMAQLLLSPLIVESPVWLDRQGFPDQRKSAARRLWGDDSQSRLECMSPSITSKRRDLNVVLPASGDEVDDPLLAESHRSKPHTSSVTVPRLFVSPEFQRPLMIVSLAMAAQQLSGKRSTMKKACNSYLISSGINAVIYYSNEILSKALPKWGPYVSLSVAAVNFLMAFPPIFLVDVSQPPASSRASNPTECLPSASVGNPCSNFPWLAP